MEILPFLAVRLSGSFGSEEFGPPLLLFLILHTSLVLYPSPVPAGGGGGREDVLHVVLHSTVYVLHAYVHHVQVPPEAANIFFEK